MTSLCFSGEPLSAVNPPLASFHSERSGAESKNQFRMFFISSCQISIICLPAPIPVVVTRSGSLLARQFKQTLWGTHPIESDTVEAYALDIYEISNSSNDGINRRNRCPPGVHGWKPCPGRFYRQYARRPLDPRPCVMVEWAKYLDQRSLRLPSSWG